MGFGTLVLYLLGGPFISAFDVYFKVRNYSDYIACAVGGPAESLPSFCDAATHDDASAALGLMGSLLSIIIVALGAILVQFLVARAIGKAAQRKHRSWKPFFWMSLLLWPLGTLVMGIIVATIAPPTTPKNESTAQSTS